LVEVRNILSNGAADESFNCYYSTLLHELLFGGSAHNLFQTDLAEYFHGALAGLCGSGMDGGIAMVFHSERTDAVVSEQHGGRQTD